MSMTIKQAFEKLTAELGANLRNPFFVGRALHRAFADIAENIEEGGSSAEDISYDNTDSGLTADDVQSAIDEVLGKLPKINYSTTEQNTGLKWIDGSDIYQKTALIEDISITAGGTADITLSTYFSNINKIVSAECVNEDGTVILPSIHVNSSLSPYSIGMAISKTDNHITFTRGTGSAAQISVYITIKYTKVST